METIVQQHPETAKYILFRLGETSLFNVVYRSYHVVHIISSIESETCWSISDLFLSYFQGHISTVFDTASINVLRS